MNKRNTYLSAVLAASLLAACGGGGNDDSTEPVATPSDSVPASAWASVAAYFGYTGSLAATETGTPLRVDEVMPPTTETGAPSPLN